MFLPTPKLLLPQWEDTDDFNVSEVNSALMRIDSKIPPKAYTSALRPTGSEVYDGLVILDTDINRYLRWSDLAGGWQTTHYNQPMAPVIPNTIANGSGVTVTGVEFYHNNGVAQMYIGWQTTSAIGAGDISNFNVCLLPVPWRPRVTTVLSSGANGPAATYYFNTAGQVVITSTGTAVTANTPMAMGGSFLLS